MDKNDYYGGAEAALSLQEVETWVEKVNDGTVVVVFAVSKELIVYSIATISVQECNTVKSRSGGRKSGVGLFQNLQHLAEPATDIHALKSSPSARVIEGSCAARVPRCR